MHRGAGAKARRACHALAARNRQHMAKRSLMPVSRAYRQQRRRVTALKDFDTLCAVPVGENPDIRHDHVACKRTPWEEKMPVLGTMERHRRRRLHRLAQRLSRLSVYA